MRRCKIDPSAIGKFDFVTDKSLREISSASLALRVGQLFRSDIDIVESCNSPITALLNAINWIESRARDGRNSIICAVEQTESCIGVVVVLVGTQAPIIIEPFWGRFIGNIECHPTDAEYASFYLKALDDTYSSYKSTVSYNSVDKPCINETGIGNNNDSWRDPDDQPVSSLEFDFIIYDREDLSEMAYARMLFNDYMSRPGNSKKDLSCVPASMKCQTPHAACQSQSQSVADISLLASARDRYNRVASAVDSDMTMAYPFFGLMSLLERMPSYELFDKRIAIFTCNPQDNTSYFCVLRVKGDTDTLRRDVS
ncbi:hypothetical protein B0H11DRAFT_2022271 [Mycena galericulata]|nr:hypothetical protein B0H11DRAFT_2022271 [Mycena galericulata]